MKRLWQSTWDIRRISYFPFVPNWEKPSIYFPFGRLTYRDTGYVTSKVFLKLNNKMGKISKDI